MKTPSELIPAASSTLAISGIKINETGLEIDPSTTAEEIAQAAGVFKMASRALSYWNSDLLAEAQKRGVAEAIASQLELDYAQTLRALTIASVPHHARRKELSPEHTWVLGHAALTPSALEYWSETAISEGLTPAELAKSIALGAIAKSRGRKKMGFETLTSLRVSFASWRKAFEERRGLAKVRAEEAETLLSELAPILDFALELERIAGQGELEGIN